MEDVAVVPGVFSCIGRSTNRGMDKLRQAVREVIAVNHVGDASKAKPEPDGNAVADDQSGIHRSPSKKDQDKTTAMGRSLRERLGLSGAQFGTTGLAGHLDVEGADDIAKDDAGEASPKEEKPSIAFTGQGKDEAVFNETARTNLNRFFVRSKAHREDPGPAVGRYRPQYGLVQKRIPGTELKERPKHPSRRIPDIVDDSRELGPLSTDSLDVKWSSTSSSSPSYNGSRPKTYEQLGLHTKRPSLNKICHIKMSEVTEPAENRDQQDRLTSQNPRLLDWDFSIPQGRKGVSYDSYFEAAKYNNKYGLVEASTKTHPKFDNRLGRAMTTGSLGRTMPKMMMLGSKGGKGTANHPDRSMYRSAPAANLRVTHVRDHTKDLARPPLVKHKAADHDENDPEACAAVHHRAMTFDADTVDKAVTVRRDTGLKMGTTLARHRAGRGARSSQNDISYRSMLGHTSIEMKHQLHCTVEESKEAPNRLRPDVGRTFDQISARTSQSTPASPLRRPRDALAPDFARSPTHHGLEVRTPVTVLPRNRKHDPIPGWSMESVQALEMEMAEDDAYMRSTYGGDIVADI